LASAKTEQEQVMEEKPSFANEINLPACLPADRSPLENPL
jgi:hypothetical protein